MKTISPNELTTNHKLKQFNRIEKPSKYDGYNQFVKHINYNSIETQLEYERDACEEELYRLRFGIENLLNNHESNDLKSQSQRKFTKPFRTMINNTNGSKNKKNTSWLDQFFPSCCRRWRKNRQDNNTNHIYNDRNDDTSQRQSSIYSDSFVSTSPSPSVSSYHIDSNRSYEDNDLKHSVQDLINQNNPNVSNLIQSKDINDPAYNSLIVKILEAKALDCLCSGYSKQNTQKQIQSALPKINQKADQHSSDLSSVSSTLNHDSSSDENRQASTLVSPVNSTYKLNDGIKSPKKNSQVMIGEDKTSKSILLQNEGEHQDAGQKNQENQVVKQKAVADQAVTQKDMLVAYRGVRGRRALSPMCFPLGTPLVLSDSDKIQQWIQ
ncbi:hypothetical protein I4U23_009641 [Adineta vaga]|nr:hypothetical protein I4U23_009641 [Adineta vaga]